MAEYLFQSWFSNDSSIDMDIFFVLKKKYTTLYEINEIELQVLFTD